MDNQYLQHYGVPGQKWGLRRYQNEDGTSTPAGQKRYEKTGEYGYTYKSHATKKYDKKTEKTARKALETIGASDRNLHENGIKVKNGDKRIAKQDKLIAKAEKYKQRADISRQIDKREMNYANSVKAGGNFLVRALTNDIVGGKGYQQHVAMNKKAQDTGSKFVSGVLSAVGGSLGSRLRKAAVIRSNEDTGLGSLGRNVGGNNFEYKTKKERLKKNSN